MIAGARKKLPTHLEAWEQQALLKQAKTKYITGLRNRAIMNLMLNMGLRISEAVNLKPGDINLTQRKLRVVEGKGKKDRDLIIPEAVVSILKEWKKRKPKNSKYFFTTIKDKKGTIKFKDGTTRDVTSRPGGKLSVRVIQAKIKKYAERAGIQKNVTPHSLRHSYGTNFIADNGSLAKLQKILGHSDINTTMIYVHLANKDVEEAMNGYKVRAV